MNLSIFKNENGQVSFFIALSFQILFIFFAMVVNVGLLVHHKINLQNSVDMAAYYGATKQAEMLNSIAHINYQMRQSFKLLSWRYRMVGSAGEQTNHPAIKNFGSGGPVNSLNFDNSILNFMPDCDSPITPPATPFAKVPPLVQRNNFFCRGVFCSNYYPLKPTPMNQSFCKNTTDHEIPLLDPSSIASSPLPGGIGGFNDLKQAAVDAYNDILKICTPQGTLNFLTLSRMIISYRFDQQARSFALVGLARSMSEKTDDLLDIDGRSVKEGVVETLKKNLTSANLEGEESIVFYNSLGSEGCNTSGTADFDPPKWLNRLNLYPSFFYTDTFCANKDVAPDSTYGGETASQTGTGIGIYSKQFYPVPKLPYHYTDKDNKNLKDEVEQNKNFLAIVPPQNDTKLLNPSIGYEKNPWCMAYVGVSAVTMPKIPFSLGGVKLAARAFAKPFGGRIGPWYGSMWPSGSKTSNTSKKVDLRLTALMPPGLKPQPNDPTLYANFSLFPGDLLGLANPKLYAYYGEAIYLLDPTLTGAAGAPDITESPSLLDWWHLIGNRGSDDRLAWNSKAQAPSPMRWLEMSIIAPNIFDTTYYSIEPDFYHRYYTRLNNNSHLRQFLTRNQVKLAPDLGYRQNYKGVVDLSEYSVRNQISDLQKFTDNSPSLGLKKFFSRFNSNFGFILKDWKNLLTSWSEKDLFSFASIDTDRFGKCLNAPEGIDLSSGEGNPKVSTTGQCIVGGTTGYHVKIVAKDYLNSKSLQLGGDSAGGGPILNPPPDDDQYWFPNMK